MFEDDFEITQDIEEAEEVAQDLVDLMDQYTREPGGMESQLIEYVNGGWQGSYE